LPRWRAKAPVVRFGPHGAVIVHKEAGIIRNPGSSGTEAKPSNSFSVLLVDDEREFADTLCERLKIRDVNAAAVYGGEQAMLSISRQQPHIVVLDLRMPDMDGMEVLQKIRAGYPQVQVIVLTGHGSDKERSQCLELGAFAFMHKPVKIEELSKVVHSALGC
jgi:two-component system response regulator CpxR